MEMKTDIFKLILSNFVEEKYWSTGDFSVNYRYTPTLSIAQIEFIFVMNILGCLNDTKEPYFMKLQDSGVGLEVPKYPLKDQKSVKVVGKYGG